jgi:hypothetical protein
MKIEIKSRVGEVLFSTDAETLRDAVIAAIESRADLSGADLSYADLSGANLSCANLPGANLFYANLTGADLLGANLRDADLPHTDLSGANLSRANLSNANFSWANLSYAILFGAELSCADLSDANLFKANLFKANLSDAILLRAKNIPGLAAVQTSILPEVGAFEAWKKCADGVLVRLRIPAHAVRSNATGRKCRASEAEVLEIIGAEKARSTYDPNFVYRVGEVVKADRWNPDRWKECGDGIHFFLTRAEAENY